MDTKKPLKFGDDFEIGDFHYEFVRKLGIDIGFLSNESSLIDFGVGKQEKTVGYWLSRIKEVYGIDLSDIDSKRLNIAILGSELEKRLEWKRMQDESSGS